MTILALSQGSHNIRFLLYQQGRAPLFRHRDKKMVGFHAFGRPGLLINDLDLAKQILITDFDHFPNRRPFKVEVFHAQYDKIFKKFLFATEGEEWKQLRSIVSPIFTSGKLREVVGSLLRVHLAWPS